MYRPVVFEKKKGCRIISISINTDVFYPCSKWQNIKKHHGGYNYFWMKQKRVWFHKFTQLKGVDLKLSENIWVSDIYEDLALQYMDGKFRLLKRLKSKGSKFL